MADLPLPGIPISAIGRPGQESFLAGIAWGDGGAVGKGFVDHISGRRRGRIFHEIVDPRGTDDKGWRRLGRRHRGHGSGQILGPLPRPSAQRTQRAAVRSAEIDLARTTIRAPISGRIGRSVYTTGALVQAGQDNALATIQRLDPIYVDIQQSSSDLLRLREDTLSGQVANDRAPVRLQLESGSMYPLEGSLRFADVTVDPATGSQTIRAVFPNPQHLLLPGMFVRGQLSQGIQARGMLVPQRAVSRNERGLPTVLVVGKNNMSELRVIQADRTSGDNWIVTGGLKPGEQVITDAGPLVRPGIPVKPEIQRGR